MTKKRQKSRRHTAKNRHHVSQHQRPRRSAEIRSLQHQILTVLYLAEEPKKAQDIEQSVVIKPTAGKAFLSSLERLIKAGTISKNNQGGYTISSASSLFTARLEMHPRGFGFAEELSSRFGQHRFQQGTGRKAPYISATKLGSAHHGDQVLVSVFNTRRGGRLEAEVIGVLNRGNDQLVGIFSPGPGFGEVKPEDPRCPFIVKLRSAPPATIAPGSAVLVRVQTSDEAHRGTTGEIIKLLGSPEHIEVQTQCVITRRQLSEKFSKRALHEARVTQDLFCSEREDLRDVFHITIDGAEARDFDDAVAVEKTRNGFKLFVSIADVSAFVRSGTTLDCEAYDRGTSIYFPHKVLPMLPEILANDRCSLVPGEDRPTLSVILEFNRQGILLKKRFTRALINSRHRFTYHTVKQLLTDQAPAGPKAHHPFLTPLRWASELATVLLARRRQRGSLHFFQAEPEITIDDSGRVDSIVPAVKHFAHQLIEEFMLAANQAAAAFLLEHGQTPLLRIHEPPDQEKIKHCSEFAQNLGLTVGQPPYDQGWINNLLEQANATESGYVVNNLLLRSMQQARYSTQQHGHFGLALEYYTHFTSPIRRYPDLIVHRQIGNLLSLRRTPEAKPETSSPAKNLARAAEHLSGAERKAVDAERELLERIKILYIAEQIGARFKGTISGVSDHGFFVELDTICISGLVPIASLRDDYYLLDVKRHRLIGDISARVFSIGQRVNSIVTGVDTHRQQITLAVDSPDHRKPSKEVAHSRSATF